MDAVPDAYRDIVANTLIPDRLTYAQLCYEEIPSSCPQQYLAENYTLRSTFLALADHNFRIEDAEFYRTLSAHYQSSESLVPLLKPYFQKLNHKFYSEGSFALELRPGVCILYFLPDVNLALLGTHNVVLSNQKYEGCTSILINTKLKGNLLSKHILTVKQNQVRMCKVRNYNPIGLAIDGLPVTEQAYFLDDLFAFNQRCTISMELSKVFKHSVLDITDIRFTLFTSLYTVANGSTQVVIFYTSVFNNGEKFPKKLFEKMTQRVFEVYIKGSNEFDLSDRIFMKKIKILLVTNGTLNSANIKELNQIMKFQLVDERALRCFLLDSVLSPVYEILSANEKEKFYAEWGLTREEMPPLILTDAAARILDISSNSVVRIIRSTTMPLDKIQPLVPVEITYRST